MKTIFVALFVLCAATAFGQTAGAISSQAQILQFPEHPEHAQPHPMGKESPVVGQGPETYTSEHGERPLWEFGPVSVEPSLGDVARAYRREKLTGKKAEIVLDKQGS